jgi:Zn-dependent M16 (insulinase) family peptidase
LAERGFEPDMVEAALNSIEFSLRENNTGSFPRGLSLFMRTLRPWINGRDPLAAAGATKRRWRSSSAAAADPGFLPGLIRTYLLDNTHRVTVTLAPSTTLNAARCRRGAARLAPPKPR